MRSILMENRGEVSRSRREFLQRGLVGMGILMTGPLLSSCREAACPALFGGDPKASPLERLGRNFSRLGPLTEPDSNGIRLPRGFSSRVVARSGHKVVDGSEYLWHGAPDGGAVFRAPDGGWVYVSNAELGNYEGGVGALRFDERAALVDAYPILQGTWANCSGGATPWETWLSCEEHRKGRVWECDPFGRREAVVWPALGVFEHEGAAVDPIRHHIYLTEDEKDGLLYRFIPDRVTAQGRPDLSRGRLEAAEMICGERARIVWHPVPDPSASHQPTRLQVAEATRFKGAEGIWLREDVVYFTTKWDERLWAYAIQDGTLSILYDATADADKRLTGADNLTCSPGGDLIAAEDGGDGQIVALTPDRGAVPILQVVGQGEPGICGPAFDPSGTRLYFSSQGGVTGRFEDGLTYEVTGPFLG